MAMSIEAIKQEIKKVAPMTKLEPTHFSEEDGLADSLVQYLFTKAKQKKDKKLKGDDKKKNYDLKSTQLRKVFDPIKALQRTLQRDINRKPETGAEPFDRSKIARLMVNLAYARGRALLPDDFYDILKICLQPDKLQTNQDFIRVAEFVEAIMAYYKFREVQGDA